MESKDPIFELAFGMYRGEVCRYCRHTYTSNADLRDRDVVWVWDKDKDPPITGVGQSIACKACWDAQPK